MRPLTRPFNPICPKHNLAFVRFGSLWGDSHGCPECVALIRADVQKARAMALGVKGAKSGAWKMGK